MQQTLLFSRLDLKAFDWLVISILAAMALATGLIVWRGDQIGLQIVDISPADAADNVSTQTDITITFDQFITEPDSAGAPLTFTPAVSGTVNWEDKSLIFSPAASLDPETTYTVRLEGDLISQDGRSLQESLSWQFQTGQPHLLYIAKDDAGSDQIFKINPIRGEPTQLTEEPFGVFDYALAPDAAMIAYSALRQDGGSDLWAVSPDGRERTPLLTCPEAVCNGIAWRPNSQTLIYERRNMLVPGAAPGPPRLWWLDLTSSETVVVFDDNQILGYGATWSPDGAWLSYIAPASQGVQVYNVEDGRNFLIPSRLGSVAVWSPQGDSLIVSDIQRNAEGFAVHLLKAAPGNGELLDITGEGQAVEDSSPTWSPDGEWMVITRKAAGAAMGKQLWLIRSDGSEAQALTDETEIHHGLPAWSPDGRFIAFQRFPLREIGATPGIWLLDSESRVIQEVVTPGNRPTWLP